ncbi:uncharacterized protein PV07_04125 [Cladophialophora immunda]|uniref:Uncharacterized protein n=1 Tax=Cladophialophora immunda TaxID=569365 RepID=A0A0D2CRM9_9EURO|nr:uncharacterized protein PV07_04125 [Cladophialophora immunda]KIW32595.1 hypothetical protein PV07_04125 [Cladophialophora immunda]
MEAIAKKEKMENPNLPKIITCPSEMVALSMADGYARVTGKAQAVIVHVDVGTQALGCALHNAHIARTPVLIFAGLCPSTLEGEERGTRTEFVNYLQDIPDQAAIVRQYCRYTNEIRSSNNVKQVVARALQIASSAPKGPVYLYAARETLERESKPPRLEPKFWKPIGPAALPDEAVQEISEALVSSKDPLIITGYTGRNEKAPSELVKLADAIPGLRVLDTSMGDMCFPANHPGWLSGKYSSHPSIPKADCILVLDCDVPYVPVKCRPSSAAKVYHIDIDPLKKSMAMYHIDAVGLWQADSYTAIKQINAHLSRPEYVTTLEGLLESDSAVSRAQSHNQLLSDIAQAGMPASGSPTPLTAALIAAELKRSLPNSTTYAVEAVTNTASIYDQLRCTVPGSYLSSGATGLGWVGGASLGIKLATMDKDGDAENAIVTQIVGDGTYLFSAPSSVYWLSSRYRIPILTIILNNKGWNAPRVSMQLVHPTGEGSRMSNRDLHISFDPSPDYAGIAKAAGGAMVWTGYAETAGDFAAVIKEAIREIMSGRTAVVECKIRGMDPKME